MRIISGKYRGLKLQSPPPFITRPTSDRAREAVFSIFSSYLLRQGKSWEEVSFLDGFAGSGAFGLEALSRGGGKVTFAENNPAAINIIKKNLSALAGTDPQSFTLAGDIFALEKNDKATPAFTLVYLDAPYGKGLTSRALSHLVSTALIDEHTFIIAEAEKGEPLPLPFCLCESEPRTFGRATLHLLYMKN